MASKMIGKFSWGLAPWTRDLKDNQIKLKLKKYAIINIMSLLRNEMQPIAEICYL